MASNKYLSQIEIQSLSNLINPATGFIGLGAKTDGLYQKIGTGSDLKLATTTDLTNYLSLSGGNITSNLNIAGNLGLGTTSPSASLEVSFATQPSAMGTTGIGLLLTRNDALSDAYASQIGLRAYQGKGVTLSGGGTGLNIQTYNGTTLSNRLRVTINGDVGIGTDSPNAKLQVVGTINATNLLLNSAQVATQSWVSSNYISTSGGSITGYLNITRINSYDPAIKTTTTYGRIAQAYYMNGEAHPREYTTGSSIWMGSGSAAVDLNLRRISANTFQVGGAGNVGHMIVQGNVTAYGEITAYSTSDKRLKTNIASIENALEKINKINPVEYNWNDKAKELNPNKTDKTDVGVIAQELKEVLPDLVGEMYNGEYLGVDYLKLIPYLVASIQELSKEITELKKQIK